MVSNDTTYQDHFNAIKIQTKQKAEEIEMHRNGVTENINEMRIRSCLYDVISTVEKTTTNDSLSQLQVNLQTVTDDLNQQLEETKNFVTSSTTTVTALVEQKTSAVEQGMLALKEETTNRLDQGVAASVKDVMSATLVEEAIQERISVLEKQISDRLKTMEAAEAEKVQKVNDTLALINNQVEQAKEDRVRLEQRVESVVGQVEEERNNSELEWQKSISEAQRQDDIEADEPLGGSSIGGGNTETTGETGTLPTVDVGFPPPSEDITEDTGVDM
jgi:hypothetical protein